MRCPVSFNWKINSEPNLSHTQPSCSSLMPSRSHAYISTTFHFPSTLAALISRTPWFNTFTDKVLSRRLNNCTPNPWYLKLLSQVFLLHCLIRHILLHVKSLHVTQGDSLSFLTSKKKKMPDTVLKKKVYAFLLHLINVHFMGMKRQSQVSSAKSLSVVLACITGLGL